MNDTMLMILFILGDVFKDGVGGALDWLVDDDALLPCNEFPQDLQKFDSVLFLVPQYEQNIADSLIVRVYSLVDQL